MRTDYQLKVMTDLDLNPKSLDRSGFLELRTNLKNRPLQSFGSEIGCC